MELDCPVFLLSDEKSMSDSRGERVSVTNVKSVRLREMEKKNGNNYVASKQERRTKKEMERKSSSGVVITLGHHHNHI
jgi:hypothetical protein